MSTQHLLDERYGRRRTRHPRLLAITAVSIAVLLAAWFAWSGAGTTRVDTDTVGFIVDDQHTVRVTFQVVVPAGTESACILEAQDVEHGVVGWKVVLIPAISGHGQTLTETVPTTALATTGFVNSCWVP